MTAAYQQAVQCWVLAQDCHNPLQRSHQMCLQGCQPGFQERCLQTPGNQGEQVNTARAPRCKHHQVYTTVKGTSTTPMPVLTLDTVCVCQALIAHVVCVRCKCDKSGFAQRVQVSAV